MSEQGDRGVNAPDSGFASDTGHRHWISGDSESILGLDGDSTPSAWRNSRSLCDPEKLSSQQDLRAKIGTRVVPSWPTLDSCAFRGCRAAPSPSTRWSCSHCTAARPVQSVASMTPGKGGVVELHGVLCLVVRATLIYGEAGHIACSVRTADDSAVDSLAQILLALDGSHYAYLLHAGWMPSSNARRSMRPRSTSRI